VALLALGFHDRVHRQQLDALARFGVGVNEYTSASFRVLVDGIVVDEVTAIGMVHQETEWLRQPAIDLARFANRTVTLTLEVAAYSNLYRTVHAKAWVDQIAIDNAVDLAPC